jgi:gliding motility-associated-like protein
MIFIPSKPCDFHIPNIFSPNGDGINDVFVLSFSPSDLIAISFFIIHDRWGNRVFSAQNIPAHQLPIFWDGTFEGKPLNPGVFFYFFEWTDGHSSIHRSLGDITLIR